MTKEKYFGQAFMLDQRINSKLEVLYSLRDLATRTTTVLGPAVVSRSRNMHSMEDVIAKIVDMENEINADIDRLIRLKAEMVGVISEIKSPKYQTLLELRYLCYKKWPEIAQMMHCSESNTYKIHAEALAAAKIPEKIDSVL